MNKKFLIIALIVVLIIGLFILNRCGGKEDTDTTTSSNTDSASKNVSSDTNDEKQDDKYDYIPGVLYEIINDDGEPIQTDFVIDGIILIGNKQTYPEAGGTETPIEALSKTSTTGISLSTRATPKAGMNPMDKPKETIMALISS